MISVLNSLRLVGCVELVWVLPVTQDNLLPQSVAVMVPLLLAVRAAWSRLLFLLLVEVAVEL